VQHRLQVVEDERNSELHRERMRSGKTGHSLMQRLGFQKELLEFAS
jgi:hypothetical protein